MSDCCLTPNEQYEELDISKNSGKPYKNTNFDKEDIFGKSQVIHVITEYSDKWRKLWIIYFILDTKISKESVIRQVYSSTCSTKKLSISMTKILHAVKGGLLSYCDKVYLRGNINQKHHIGGVMVSVLASSAIDHEFESRSGQTKDYKIGICCSAKHSALRRKSKDWLARNQNNVSEWSDISTRGLLFQWASTKKIQLSVLV